MRGPGALVFTAMDREILGLGGVRINIGGNTAVSRDTVLYCIRDRIDSPKIHRIIIQAVCILASNTGLYYGRNTIPFKLLDTIVRKLSNG